MALSDYNFIESSGVIVPDTSAVQGQVIQMFQDAFGADLITDASTPQGALISMFTTMLVALITNNAQLANQINPDLAGGVFLDAIAELTGLQRTPAQRSQCVAIVSGSPGTLIPISVIAVTDSGNQFSPIAPILIGSDGTGSGVFRALASGPIPIAADTLNTINVGVLGWETVNNPSQGVVGGLPQSDAQLRSLRQNTLALQSTALPEAITSALLGEDIGVKSLWFQENVANTVQTINGISMSPHSIYVCVTNNSPLNYTQVIEDITAITGISDTSIPVLNPFSFYPISVTSTGSTGNYTVTVTGTDEQIANFKNGDQVIVQFADQDGYNGTFTIGGITPGGTTFTYTSTATSLATPATGDNLGVILVPADGVTNYPTVPFQVSDGTHVFQLIEPFNIPYSTPPTYSVSSATSTGTTGDYLVTITVPSTSGLTPGSSVSIAGAVQTGYNGIYTISNVTSTTFQYTSTAVSLTSPATGTITATAQNITGLGQAVFQATVANSSLAVASNTLTTIVNPIAGVYSVTNPSPNTAYDVGFLESVAATLLAKKSAGCAWSTGPGAAPYGPQNITVVEPSSKQEYLVSFDVPTPTPILIEAIVYPITFVGDPQTSVQEAILLYASGGIPGYDGFTVGNSVSVFDITSAIATVLPGLSIVSMESSLLSVVDFDTTPIAIAPNQQATIQLSAISVITASSSSG